MGTPIGIIRMVYPNAAASELFLLLRNLMLAALDLGLAAGAILALILAVNIGKPVMQVTRRFTSLPVASTASQLYEQGPQESTQPGTGDQLPGGTAKQPGASAPRAAGQPGARARSPIGSAALGHPCPLQRGSR